METFDDEQDLLAAKLRTILGKSKAIMTSRVKWKPTNGLHQIALESLPIQDAVSLMRSFAAECGIHRVSTASNNDLISIAEQVGRLALALRLATGQLLLQDLDSIQTSINQISSSFTEELFDYLFKSSINILNKHEKDLLIAVAQFDEATGADSNTLREMAVVEGTVFDDAISKIVRLSLVEVGGDLKNTRYFLHALAYTYVKQKLEGMRL